MKTFDLTFIDWVTAMTVRARAVSSFEALSLGVYFIVHVLLWLWRAEGEVACCSLLRHDFLVISFSFCFFIGCMHSSYVKDRLDLT